MTRARKPAPQNILTDEQRQEARAKFDAMLEAGCWPIVICGEDADGSLVVMSAPVSGVIMRGMARQLAELLCPEMFE